ncbi:MAG: alpha/beta hydrolase [Thermomicrobiales bacterium]
MTAEHDDNWVQSEPAPDRTVYQIDSPLVGDRLEITAVPPLGYDAATDPVPVLFALDPFLTLDMVVGFSRLLGTLSFGHVPPALVVGVGYPTCDLGEFMGRRARDFTPTPGPFPPEIPIQPPYGLGGAPALLRCLTEEVVPGIAARYRVHPTDRTLIGYSLGGLFGLYTLFHQPKAFSRYLLVSPSTWWDDGVVFDFEQTWTEGHRDLPTRVFMSVGEEQPGRGWRNEMMPDEALLAFQMVARLRDLAQRLESRNDPGLALHSVVFPNEQHITTFPAALGRGLVWLFAGDD